MGKFNELLAARYNELISGLFGLQEQEGVSTVSPELMPVFMAEGERAEHSYLKYERLAAGQATVAAVAAQFGMGQLMNPVGSNLFIVVERIQVSLAAAGTLVSVGITFPQGTPLATNSNNAGARDTRWLDPASIAGKVAGQVRFGSSAAPAVYAGQTTWRVNGGVEWTDVGGVYVLTPGYGLQVQHQTVNTAFDVSFFWRERALAPEENGSG